jgi:hypothetical protein
VTWDQFVALALGLAATALVRLLDRWLPPTDEHAAGMPAVVIAPPPRSDEIPILGAVDPDEVDPPT